MHTYLDTPIRGVFIYEQMPASVAVLAEILLRSPRKKLIISVTKYALRINVPKKPFLMQKKFTGAGMNR